MVYETYSTQRLTGNSSPGHKRGKHSRAFKQGFSGANDAAGGITGALAYGISSGCDYCGPVIASLWSVALLVVLPIIWSWSRTSREVRECIKKQCHCDHEFIQEEHQEVMAWHG